MEASIIPEHIHSVNRVHGSHTTPLVYDRQGRWVWKSGAANISGSVAVRSRRWAWLCFGKKGLRSFFSEKDILFRDAW